MNQSIITKLETLCDRYEELEGLLSDAEIINDQNKYRDFSKEYAELEPLVKCFQEYKEVQINLVEAKVSNRSINRKISSLKSFYKYLQKIKIIQNNPLSNHKALKTLL